MPETLEERVKKLEAAQVEAEQREEQRFQNLQFRLENHFVDLAKRFEFTLQSRLK